MKIAIYTLTNQRDKYIDEMLAEKLRGKGHDVVVRNYVYGARESICYEKPDLIIHPMVGGEYKMDTVEKCHQWGIHVIVRRGEAGQGREQFDALDDNRKDLILGHWDYSPYVDLELVWGNEFADIIAEQGWMPRNKLKACGAFAFDPYFEKTDDIPIERKPTILFATGFSTADSMPGYCETGLPEESDYHNELHKIHLEARTVWFEMIDRIVKNHSDEWDFELKVRPGETALVYKDKVPACVKIHSEGTPSSTVLRSVDVLVHSGSTLAIEAHLLNVPSFNFFNVNPDPLLSKVSQMTWLWKDLDFAIKRVLKEKRTNINEAVYQELINHLYGEIDGKACDRAACEIDDYTNKALKTYKNIPSTWPKEPKYFIDDGIQLEKQEGLIRWSCPCCRNVWWGGEVGIHNCPYCNMKIERAKVTQAVAK